MAKKNVYQHFIWRQEGLCGQSWAYNVYVGSLIISDVMLFSFLLNYTSSSTNIWFNCRGWAKQKNKSSGHFRNLLNYLFWHYSCIVQLVLSWRNFSLNKFWINWINCNTIFHISHIPDSAEIPDREWPIEGELNHVVNPDIWVNLEGSSIGWCGFERPTNLVIWVVVPAVPDVPEPRFSPQALEPVDQDQGVEKPPS